jgi:DNA-binding response OmpR family regulator
VALQILIVEPDDRLRDSVRLHLSLEGYECDARRQLDTAGDLAADRFDLAVVNVQTTRPGVPHYARDRAAKRVSTLLLADPGSRGDALSALEQWADDYVTLPVEMRELIARAHALVRRKGMADASVDTGAAGGAAAIVHQGLLIDPSRRLVDVGGRCLALTEQEFRLLHALAQRPGVVLSRAALLPVLGSADPLVSPRSVTAVVMRIRQRLRMVPTRWHIATVRGIGYTLKSDFSSEKPLASAAS